MRYIRVHARTHAHVYTENHDETVLLTASCLIREFTRFAIFRIRRQNSRFVIRPLLRSGIFFFLVENFSEIAYLLAQWIEEGRIKALVADSRYARKLFLFFHTFRYF